MIRIWFFTISYFMLMFQCFQSMSLVVYLIALEVNALIFVMVVMNYSSELSDQNFYYFLINNYLSLFFFLIVMVYGWNFKDDVQTNMLLIGLFILKLGLHPGSFWVYRTAIYLSSIPFIFFIIVQKIPLFPSFDLNTLGWMEDLFLWNMIIGLAFMYFSYSLEIFLVSSSLFFIFWMWVFYNSSPPIFCFYYTFYFLSVLSLYCSKDSKVKHSDLYTMPFMLLSLGVPPLTPFLLKSAGLLTFHAPGVLQELLVIFSFLVYVAYFKFFYQFFMYFKRFYTSQGFLLLPLMIILMTFNTLLFYY